MVETLREKLCSIRFRALASSIIEATTCVACCLCTFYLIKHWSDAMESWCSGSVNINWTTYFNKVFFFFFIITYLHKCRYRQRFHRTVHCNKICLPHDDRKKKKTTLVDKHTNQLILIILHNSILHASRKI